MDRMRVLLLMVASGCMTYTPNSFVHGPGLFAGERATIGCLDLAVQRRDDFDKSAVLAYKFGNRCDSPQRIDLANAIVIGRDAAGGEHRLRPFDPRGEIKPMPIDARLMGHEVIAYVADQIGVELVQVCVDAASIVGAQSERWMCLARKPEPIPEDPGDETLIHEESV